MYSSNSNKIFCLTIYADGLQKRIIKYMCFVQSHAFLKSICLYKRKLCVPHTQLKTEGM